MSRRPPIFKLLGISCVIVPVAFYVGFKLRGGRIIPEGTDTRRRQGVMAAPQEYARQLQNEIVDLEKQRLSIERKIAEVKQRAAAAEK